jgi:flavin reductase (DIM6/NTAB) family NADH-FMN oxidoreductase RutF
MSLRSVDRDETGFRAALGSVAASVNVITMWGENGQPLGMTATAFSSVSVDPLLVLVCINRSTRTYDHIAKAGRFGVNILGSTAHHISDYCSQPGSDKYLDSGWLAQAGEWQSPALSGALAFLDCQVDQDVTAGTHAVLIGSVEGIGLSSSAQQIEPLLHFRGGYRQLESLYEHPRPRPLPIIEELA